LVENDKNDNKQHLYDTFFHATLGKLPLLNIIEYLPYQRLRSLYTEVPQVEGHFKYRGKKQLIKSAHFILKDKFLRSRPRQSKKNLLPFQAVIAGVLLNKRQYQQ